jgi:hypothetical protein
LVLEGAAALRGGILLGCHQTDFKGWRTYKQVEEGVVDDADDWDTLTARPMEVATIGKPWIYAIQLPFSLERKGSRSLLSHRSDCRISASDLSDEGDNGLDNPGWLIRDLFSVIALFPDTTLPVSAGFAQYLKEPYNM